jgi:hypothetical protein
MKFGCTFRPWPVFDTTLWKKPYFQILKWSSLAGAKLFNLFRDIRMPRYKHCGTDCSCTILLYYY